jgi:hypothetical protein
MNALAVPPPHPDPSEAANLLANLGFLASSDLPDRPGPAYLLVALRPEPTLRHYDPERVDYWLTVAARGVHEVLTRDTRLPIASEFSWGLIRIVDRLKVSNEYLTLGGRLAVESVQGATIAVFTSPAPLLRRGGHSQGWDHGAECLGAFFGRLLVAVDFVPGFEDHLATASPLARYAAFVRDVVGRYRGSPELRSDHPELWTLLDVEERRLQRDHATEWSEGAALLHQAEVGEPILL